MNIYKLNRALHRDLGYFFIGMTIIYAISGIAINHLRDWNPNYIIKKSEFRVDGNLSKESIDQAEIADILSIAGEKGNYKNHYFPNDGMLRIFIEGGNVLVDLESGQCVLETNRRRPFFFQINRLHYNPGVLWLWFSDAFCVALIFLSISGLFILKGKNGLKWRGAILGSIGIIIPLLFILFYL